MITLEGVRVISVEQYGAGPYATLHLADLGAEVIKIEQPNGEGDMGRTMPPYTVAGDSLFFQGLNRNKQSITLDVTKPDGRDVLRRLAQNADAVFSNLRGDLPARMGLTFADLKDVNPRIVCCHLTGYGTQGERAAEPAYDYLIQAEAGIMDLTGEPDGPPSRAGVSMVDWMGGVSAAFAMVSGILSAPHQRQRGRPGREPARRRILNAQLPGHLVPEQRLQAGAVAGLRSPHNRPRRSASPRRTDTSW